MIITRHYHKITWPFLGQCVAVALQLSFQSRHFRVLESFHFDNSEVRTGMTQGLRPTEVLSGHCSQLHPCEAVMIWVVLSFGSLQFIIPVSFKEENFFSAHFYVGMSPQGFSSPNIIITFVLQALNSPQLIFFLRSYLDT